MPTSATGISEGIQRPEGGPGTNLPGAHGRGFTLIELLVVVVIVGIFAGAAVLSMGVLGNDREIEHEAFRLRSLLDLLREEALMQSRDYGVLFTDVGYRFYAYDYQQLRWVVPVGENLFVPHDVEDGLRVDLRVEDRDLVLDGGFELNPGDENEDQPEPQIMILSSGEITPFEAAFSRESAEGRFVLTADLDGSFEISEDGFDR